MKKNRLLNLLLVGGLMITSAAISLSSCKKENNEANEDVNLPTIENVFRGERDTYSFACPYCYKIIQPYSYHEHHFSPREGENTLPSNWQELNLTWGILDSIDQYGNIVYDTDGITPLHQRMGNRAKPFTVEFCESYWNLPPGIHPCKWCVGKVYHRHRVYYKPDDEWQQISNGYHVGGGVLEP